MIVGATGGLLGRAVRRDVRDSFLPRAGVDRAEMEPRRLEAVLDAMEVRRCFRRASRRLVPGCL